MLVTTDSPVSSRIRMRANRSGYSARTFPGTFMAIEALKKPEIFCSTKLSNVELQARATLAVPVEKGKKRGQQDDKNLKGKAAESCSPITYDRIRFHPVMKAQISPTVT